MKNGHGILYNSIGGVIFDNQWKDDIIYDKIEFIDKIFYIYINYKMKKIHCPICYEEYTKTGKHEGKVLQNCGHTFCLFCLLL